MIHDLLFKPFEDETMRRALAACIALAFGGAPIGVFLVLRRTALIGDALSHAILPGVALAFVFAGFSLVWMTIGGVLAGLTVALLAGASARLTSVAEDASLAAFFIISLALGTLLVSSFGTSEDLLHVLFGNVRELTGQAVLTIATIATGSMVVLAIVYRALIAECFDPGFLRAAGWVGAAVHAVFLSLVVLNLVGGFQALGTLMAVGLMMLPAVTARFWAETAGGQIAVAVGLTVVAAVVGLLGSFHLHTHPEASIVLVAGALYVVSLCFGPRDSIAARMIRLRHLEA